MKRNFMVIGQALLELYRPSKLAKIDGKIVFLCGQKWGAVNWDVIVDNYLLRRLWPLQVYYKATSS